MTYSLSAADKDILNQISRSSFEYFKRFTDRATGLTRDSSQTNSQASIGATGFYLAALGIAKENKWLDEKEIYTRAQTTLLAALNLADHEHGFFYHFLHPRTAKRTWKSEASSIDTALFIAGALYAGEVFKNTEVETLANLLYDRVDWNWMTNGRNRICHGWKPETGFLPYYWDMYSEHLILQALALGASQNPVEPDIWNGWQRTKDSYNQKEIVYAFSGSLFTYQYPHAFIDFRNLSDNGIDYFENSVKATLANREFTLSHAGQYAGYGLAWGITACISQAGYIAYGAPPCGVDARCDGTIAPSAAIGSLPFTPEHSLQTIRYMWSIRDKVFTDLGFIDSFNLDKNWYSQDYIAIDQGISLLMIENFLGGKVWGKFMGLPAVKRWIEKASLAKM